MDRQLKTDWLEFWVRFGCETIFGLVLGLYLTLKLFSGPLALPLSTTSDVALGFGIAEVRYGDIFWERILPILRSWLMWL
jgi:hypothetical protein